MNVESKHLRLHSKSDVVFLEPFMYNLVDIYIIGGLTVENSSSDKCTSLVVNSNASLIHAPNRHNYFNSHQLSKH